MRILYSHRIQSRDGQSVHVEELVAALRRAGHEVLVVGPGIYAAADFGGESWLVARLRRRLPRSLGDLAELAYNFPAYIKLQRAYRKFRPDIIYERYNLFYFAGALLARRRDIPFYLEVNSPLADERRRNGELRLEGLARSIERRVWRGANRIAAVTEVLRSILIAQGAPGTRVEVVPNGIDKQVMFSVLDRPDAVDGIVLGFVGFVRPWHGIDRVLRAMATDTGAQDLKLVVAGDGPARQDLESVSQRLGLEARVRFTGLVTRDQVPLLLASFDIALQPAVVPYASPLKLFEYMAAGRAIVAPDQPNIREILTHEKTALLYEATQEDAMWQQIRRLAGDAALRRRLGQAAREEIVTRDYTWDGNAARVMAWAAADLAHLACARAGCSEGKRMA